MRSYCRSYFPAAAVLLICAARPAGAERQLLLREGHADVSRRVPTSELGRVVGRPVTFEPRLTLVTHDGDSLPASLRRHYRVDRPRFKGEAPLDTWVMQAVHDRATAHTHQGLSIGNLVVYVFDTLTGRHVKGASRQQLAGLESLRQDLLGAFLALHPPTQLHSNPNWFRADTAAHVFDSVQARVRQLFASGLAEHDAKLFPAQPLALPLAALSRYLEAPRTILDGMAPGIDSRVYLAPVGAISTRRGLV